MPEYLIDRDLREARLLSIAGKHLKGGQAEVVAARRRDTPHGPISNRLWSYIEEQAAQFAPTIA
jgi:hypothetical protein